MMKPVCRIDGCERAAHARGLCGRCYKRAQSGRTFTDKPLCRSVDGCDNIARTSGGRFCITHAIPVLFTHGEPAPIGPHYRDLIGPCEIVDGAGDGYGRVRGGARAHRWVWEREHGLIPDGLVVRHLCDRPGCVAIDHLELGTQADNVRDRDRRGRTTVVHGERHGRSKLTADDVRTIRRRYAAGGVTKQALADEYGVSRTAISLVITRSTWKHA